MASMASPVRKKRPDGVSSPVESPAPPDPQPSSPAGSPSLPASPAASSSPASARRVRRLSVDVSDPTSQLHHAQQQALVGSPHAQRPASARAPARRSAGTEREPMTPTGTSTPESAHRALGGSLREEPLSPSVPQAHASPAAQTPSPAAPKARRAPAREDGGAVAAPPASPPDPAAAPPKARRAAEPAAAPEGSAAPAAATAVAAAAGPAAAGAPRVRKIPKEEEPRACVALLKTTAHTPQMMAMMRGHVAASAKWTASFATHGGVPLVVEAIRDALVASAAATPRGETNGAVVHEALELLKAVMTHASGLQAVAACMKQIAGLVDDVPDSVRISVFELMRQARNERSRFSFLVKIIAETASIPLKVKALFLVNTLISSPGELDTRVYVRNEFISIGLPDTLSKVREASGGESPELLELMDVYDEMESKDKEALLERLKFLGADPNDHLSLFQAIQRRMAETHSPCSRIFLSILQSLATLPVEDTDQSYTSTAMWVMVERLLLQVSLQKQTIAVEESAGLELREMLEHAVTASERALRLQLEEKVSALAALTQQKEQVALRLFAKETRLMVLTNRLARIDAERNQLASSTASLKEELEKKATLESDRESMVKKLADMERNLEPAAAAVALPVVPSVKPGCKMKGLQWNKIPPAKLSQTIWAQIVPKEPDYLDYKELENMFAAKESQTAPGGAAGAANGGAASSEPKPGSVSLIDGKKSQNLGILLAKFKGSLEETRDELLKMNEAVFNEQMLRTLQQFGIPSDDEVERIVEYSKAGKKHLLARPDVWFLLVHDVPHLEGRIKCFIFSQRFPVRLSDVRPNADSLSQALSEVRSSASFKKILELVLVVGNFLNGGTFRGGANGVRLDALGKLADVKAKDNRSTLLGYLVRLAGAKHPESLAFVEELKHVPEAAKVSFSAVKTEVSSLRKELSAVQAEVKVIADDTAAPSEEWHHTKPFLEKMATFEAVSVRELTEVEASTGKIESEFTEVASLFGEDPSAVQPEDFFGGLSKFIAAFQKLQGDIEREKEAAAKTAKREADKKKKDEVHPGTPPMQRSAVAAAAAAGKGSPTGTGGFAGRRPLPVTPQQHDAKEGGAGGAAVESELLNRLRARRESGGP
eukprot:m51a1_g4166 putative actin binding protein (1117) ;mRNA; r:292692-297037